MRDHLMYNDEGKEKLMPMRTEISIFIEDYNKCNLIFNLSCS